MSEWSVWKKFSSETISAPSSAGVYQLGAPDNIDYIGESVNIQRRLNEHRREDCTKHAEEFCYLETPNHESREKTLLNEYKSKHGRFPKCNDRL